MRPRLSVLVATLLLSSAAVARAQQDVKIRLLDEPITDLRAYAAGVKSAVAPGTGSVLAARSAGGTSDVLLVPYYEVDPEDPSGPDTLFAVHNETDLDLPVRILYLTRTDAQEQRVEEISLAPRATKTINLRDVPGLAVDADGIARGLVILGVVGSANDGSSDLLSGDFFYVDSRTDYATASNLANLSIDDPGNELCAEWGSRFLNGGAFSGRTEYRVVVDMPQGGADFASPTAIGTVYDESGAAVQSFEIRTDLHTFRLSAADLVPPDMHFGSLAIRFPSTEGLVLAEHSGFNRLSVALKAACRDDVP